jgi:hypothetical protein
VEAGRAAGHVRIDHGCLHQLGWGFTAGDYSRKMNN